MTAKSNLSSSLQRLLGRSQEGASRLETDWLAWFNAPQIRHAHLSLQRAGEEVYTSLPLEAKREDNGTLSLVVDSLLPSPGEDFWTQPVMLHGRIQTFDAGIEEIVTFSASVGDRIEYEGREAVELRDLIDLERSAHEYVADLGPGHQIELGMIWFGEWVQVRPSQITVSRIIFDADLFGEIGVDGYAVPKATLKLEEDGPEVPVRLHLTRRRMGGFEAAIEKIDGVAKQKLVSIIEEIWRTSSGLSQQRLENGKTDVGYRFHHHDPLASVFNPHIVLLGGNKRWEELLGGLGELLIVDEKDFSEVSRAVSEQRCDMIVGDADLWGDQAVRIERLLRSVSRFREIPRIWFTSRDPETAASEAPRTPAEVDREDETQSGGRDDEEEPRVSLDLVDYGAYDLVSVDLEREELSRRFTWALGGEALGDGANVLLVSQNPRLRYRLGLHLAGGTLRFTTFGHREGLIPELEKVQPRWVLLDADSFEVEIDPMLGRVVAWTRTVRSDVIVLARAADQRRVTTWLKAGARDIVLLDPSLRQAAERLRVRLHGNS